VSVSGFGGTAEAWIPSVLVCRRAVQPPLVSTFIGVIEPYEGRSNIAAIRRLALEDSEETPCPDGHVGIEIQLADGRRDLYLSRDIEHRPATPSASTDGARVVGPATQLVEKESNTRFEGDLCLVRFNAAQHAERALLCRAKSLRVGDLFVRSKNAEASFEICLENIDGPVVAGQADAVALIEIAGVRLWPKD